jgi:hypothetical protein
MEDETFIPGNRGGRRLRSPSPQQVQPFGQRPSAEHQERQKQLFEKYGNARAGAEASRSVDEVDRPDVMRLG